MVLRVECGSINQISLSMREDATWVDRISVVPILFRQRLTNSSSKMSRSEKMIKPQPFVVFQSALPTWTYRSDNWVGDVIGHGKLCWSSTNLSKKNFLLNLPTGIRSSTSSRSIKCIHGHNKFTSEPLRDAPLEGRDPRSRPDTPVFIAACGCGLAVVHLGPMQLVGDDCCGLLQCGSL